jgi:hypothetical protein
MNGEITQKYLIDYIEKSREEVIKKRENAKCTMDDAFQLGKIEAYDKVLRVLKDSKIV